MKQRLVIANRGEIARRILRAARGRDYEIAVISTAADLNAPVRLQADAVLEVSSFLDIDQIVQASLSWDATCLHPGYGFLSENDRFAAAVEQAGITFIGPSPETLQLMGDKERSKQLAVSCGISVVPSLESWKISSQTLAEIERQLATSGIKAPWMIKAAFGGGGRGMRVVHHLAHLPELLERASSEAAAGFGDGTVFIEQYIHNARHIEVQFFGDGCGGGIFLGERECSLQRKHQKVIEEAPAPGIDQETRMRLGRMALNLVNASRYRGAGTVEFLVDEANHFYFLEVNARLQVEHPVTEIAYEVDLVDAQLELAEGKWPRQFSQFAQIDQVHPRFHAIEARLLAEDPAEGFLPTPGRLLRYTEPNLPNLRVDSGYCQGGEIPSSFDSLVAKVIARGSSRNDCLTNLRQGLDHFIIHGCRTNASFLKSILRHPEVQRGTVAARWIEEHLAELTRPTIPLAVKNFFAQKHFLEKLTAARHRMTKIEKKSLAMQIFSQVSNGYFNSGSGVDLDYFEIEVTDAERGEFVVQGAAIQHLLKEIAPSEARDRLAFVATPLSANQIALTILGETLLMSTQSLEERDSSETESDEPEVVAPMAGKVLTICVREGQQVESGETLFVLESMKMQIDIKARRSSRIVRVKVGPGQILAGNEPMASLGYDEDRGEGICPIAGILETRC